MKKDKESLVRVGSRFSVDLNNWLDQESARTGLSKSSIVMLAVENYRREKEALFMMADIGQLVDKLDDIEKAVKGDHSDYGDHSKNSD